MTREEFSTGFDTYFNNITSNQAPGLNEHEKSLFLTKAQDEITKDHFTANSKGNDIGQGFDDSAKRQADFSCLMKVWTCDPTNIAGTYKYICIDPSFNVREFSQDYFTFLNGTTPVTPVKGEYTINNATTITVSGGGASYTVSPSMPYTMGRLIKTGTGTNAIKKIDSRSTVYAFPADLFIAINEEATTGTGAILQILPLRYDEYVRLMSKPFKRPLKNQAWRLINSGAVSNGNTSSKCVELIAGPGVVIDTYTIRYIRRAKPIITGDLDGLTINGYYLDGGTVPSGTATAIDGECELDPILHEDILQRAVELAKIAWTATGNDNAQLVVQAGQRSE